MHIGYTKPKIDIAKERSLNNMKEQGKKNKGFLSMIIESMKKSGESCGPDCGCHAVENTNDVDVNDKNTKNIKLP